MLPRRSAQPRRRHGLGPTAALLAVWTCSMLPAAPVGGDASYVAASAASVRATAAVDRAVDQAVDQAVDRDGDGLTDRAELGAAAVSRPSLGPLTTALARRRSQPVRLLFLGSSTSYGIGASSPAAGFVNQVVTRLQDRFPAGSATSRAPRGLRESTDRPDETPGVQGVNGAVGGSTAATYFTEAHAYAVGVVQPTCVVHLIGSNDSVARVPVATFLAQVEAVVRRIDAVSARPPCHLLLQPVRRFQVSLEAWQEYRDGLQQLALRRARTTFVDLGSAFEVRDALGDDPADLIGPDAVHPTDAGHALLARTLVDGLDLARRDLGTGSHPRRADTDRDGITDGREVRGRVVRQRVVACSGTVRLRLRARSVPYLKDTDADTITDRREVEGHRLVDGRVVRTDPADPDTDGDGRADGREATRPGADPTTCAPGRTGRSARRS